jgi:hypothetical protein
MDRINTDRINTDRINTDRINTKTPAREFLFLSELQIKFSKLYSDVSI